MKVRPVCASDAQAVAGVYLASWRAAFGHLLTTDLVPDEVLLARGVRLVAGSCCVVGELDRQVVCFATGNLHSGELSMLYAAPSNWGAGIASAVLESVTARLCAGGHRPKLWMWDQNDRAAALYIRHGWCVDGRAKSALVAGVPFRYVGLTWSGRPGGRGN